MTRAERAEMYRQYLAEEGYSPKIDDDGDVFFKYEGRGYFIVVSEKDDEFFNLLYPNFWSIESDAERAKVTEAALYATARTKVAKVFPTKSNTWAVIEMFCCPPETFKSVFRRCLAALRVAVENFRTKMHEEPAQAPNGQQSS
jgi:hypothetical protein